jgi:ATP-dependent Clp protease adaptor protein ClpS
MLKDMEDQRPDEGSDVLIEDSIELKEPPKFCVVLHNDDYTTMEFVIEVLQRFFRKSYEESMKVMLNVHHQGKGVAGIYSREIAETKVAQVTAHALENGQPLKCTAEPMD